MWWADKKVQISSTEKTLPRCSVVTLLHVVPSQTKPFIHDMSVDMHPALLYIVIARVCPDCTVSRYMPTRKQTPSTSMNIGWVGWMYRDIREDSVGQIQDCFWIGIDWIHIVHKKQSIKRC
jgi:hypothetical protein